VDREQRVELAVRVAGIVTALVWLFALARRSVLNGTGRHSYSEAGPWVTFGRILAGTLPPLVLGVALACLSGPISKWVSGSGDEPPYTEDNLRLGLLLLGVYYTARLLGSAVSYGAQAYWLPATLAPAAVLSVLVATCARPLAARLCRAGPDESDFTRRVLAVALPVTGSFFCIRAIGGVAATGATAIHAWQRGVFTGSADLLYLSFSTAAPLLVPAVATFFLRPGCPSCTGTGAMAQVPSGPTRRRCQDRGSSSFPSA
jgi:hypothetical protein